MLQARADYTEKHATYSVRNLFAEAPEYRRLESPVPTAVPLSPRLLVLLERHFR